jgi:hypothetical protein
MQTRIVVPIVGAVAASILLHLGNMLFGQVLGEVNRRSPEADKISAWWVRSRLPEVYRRHRELYPLSKKRVWTRLALAAGVALWVVSGVAFYLLNS